MSQEENLKLVQRHIPSTDVAIVEGVMGLFDGRDGKSEDGSTAQIAKWLGAPVILVVDCWAFARSVAAVVQGYKEFDKALDLAGVILNKGESASPGRGSRMIPVSILYGYWRNTRKLMGDCKSLVQLLSYACTYPVDEK